MFTFLGPTSFSFKGINWKKVLMGVLAAAAGAILTYLTGVIGGIDWSQVHVVIGGMEFGQIVQLVVMAAWTSFATVVRKFVSDNE